MRRFEYFEEVVVAACREVRSCGADEKLLVCERREDEGEMFGRVEEIEVQTAFEWVHWDATQLDGLDFAEKSFRFDRVVGEDVDGRKVDEGILRKCILT